MFLVYLYKSSVLTEVTNELQLNRNCSRTIELEYRPKEILVKLYLHQINSTLLELKQKRMK